jgi:uncharacterized protein
VLNHLVRITAVAALFASSEPGMAQPTAFATESLTVARAPGRLAGTLLAPAVSNKVPVVLIIAGSGPTDRDGNSGPVKASSLKQLAESLAVRGVASLRFDKRGIGGSRSAFIAERDLRFETLADDAGAWLDHLSGDARFSHVVVLGHSEGALVGLLALKGRMTAGYVSLAGSARPIDQVIHDQLAAQLPPGMLAQTDSILSAIREGREVTTIPAGLEGLFRPSVQPFLTSTMRYTGEAELTTLRKPCLIVQGMHDIQVLPLEGERLAKANPRCIMARIAGMNHPLKASPSDRMAQMSTYYTPDAPLADGLVDAIVSFVLGLK